MYSNIGPLDPEAVTATYLVTEHRNKLRKILSRRDVKSLGITSSLAPGQRIDGCLVCCAAPACCPMFSACPCCSDAKYIQLLRASSSYFYIRENSIEWNDPEIVMQRGPCCGVDPCLYEVQDNVKVLYFDDVMFERMTDQTRTCHECRTCLFGGKGERVQIDSPVCCSCCQRGSFPCLFVPVCCPSIICPCILRHEIYLEDAQKGLYEIKKARSATLKDSLYYTLPPNTHI
jgi:hypothetical protein